MVIGPFEIRGIDTSDGPCGPWVETRGGVRITLGSPSGESVKRTRLSLCNVTGKIASILGLDLQQTLVTRRVIFRFQITSTFLRSGAHTRKWTLLRTFSAPMDRRREKSGARSFQPRQTFMASSCTNRRLRLFSSLLPLFARSLVALFLYETPERTIYRP